MSINYEDYDELDSDSSFDGAINIIEDQDGGTIVFNSSELMSANFDGGIPKTVVTTSIESATDPLDMGDYIFWNFSTNQSFNPSPTDTVDGTIDESDDPADYYDTYLVTGIESDEDEVTYNISVMLEDEEYVIEGVGGTQTIYAIKEDWDEKELGDTGWLITSSGNAIFTNVAARGTIQANDGYLKNLDVTGTLRIQGVPEDDETTAESLVRLLVLPSTLVDPSGSAKTNPSVVINKNGLIVRSNVGGTVKKIFKVPLDGKNIFISGYTNDDNNKDPDDPNPPDLTGNEIVIGGKNNNLTLNGGKGNKAIFTTITGTKTDFGDSTPGFILQTKDLDGAGNWKTRLKLAGSGTGAGSLIFDGTNLTVTGAINATSGNFTSTVTVGGATSGTLRIGTSTTGVATITGTNNASGTFISIHNPSTVPSWANANTPFYVNAEGKFSLGNAISWDPTVSGGPPVLQINGILRGFVNETTGVPVPLTGTNAMGIGLFVNYTGLTGTVTSGSKILTMSNTASLVSGMSLTKTSGSGTFASGTKVVTILSSTQAELSANATASGSITFSSTNATDNVVGIGIKINSTNYWFADGSPRMKIGTEKNYLEYNSSADRVSLSGELFTTRARISSFYIQNDRMFIPRFSTETASSVAFNSGGIGDTIQVLVTDGTIGNNNYVWTETNDIDDPRPILIGQITNISPIVIGGVTYSQGTIIAATGTSIIGIGEWSDDQIIRFSTSATFNDLRYNGFGSTNTYSIFTGATNSNGIGAQFRVNHTGDVYIGNTLTVVSLGTSTVSTVPNVRTDADGLLKRTSNANSSLRYKNSVLSISQVDELDPYKILDIDIVSFKYNSDYLSQNDQRFNRFLPGFIAEQMYEVYPIAVDTIKDSNGNDIPDAINSAFLLPGMLKLIQNQHQKIQQLEERLAILEG